MRTPLVRIGLAVAILVSPLCVDASTITVFSDGVKGSAELYKLGSDEYIDADVLAAVFSVRYEWDPDLYKGKVIFPEHTVALIPDNPFVSIDGSLISVPVTPQFRGGKLFIPIWTVPPLFSEVSGRDIVWDAKLRVLTIGHGSPNIKGLRFSSSGDETNVVIDLAGPLKYTGTRVSDDKYEIFLERGVLKSSEISSSEGKDLVRSVHAVNVEDGARVVMNLARKNTKVRLLPLENPTRLLVIFGPGKKEVKKEEYRLEVVVVDPGHGGKDPGAMGPTGLQEKVVTLDIAKRLAELLKKNLGIKVILTRTKDEFVSLRERADIANKNEAELFISVHCNAARKRDTEGTETYFLSEAKTDWTRAVEARENAVIRFELPEGSKDTASLEYILWDMAQKEFLNESSELAELIHEQLTGRLSVEDRGLKQANFFVLRGCYMPAVLVEVAFLSNRKEEKLLRKKSFRQKAAEGVYEGVKEFKKIYEKKLNL
jgi:N-acetylmuramoyl-L-alanine amidase